MEDSSLTRNAGAETSFPQTRDQSTQTEPVETYEQEQQTEKIGTISVACSTTCDDDVEIKTVQDTNFYECVSLAELDTKEKLDDVVEEKCLDEVNHTPGDEAIDVIDSAKSSTRERQDESREDLHVKELTGSRESSLQLGESAGDIQCLASVRTLNDENTTTTAENHEFVPLLDQLRGAFRESATTNKTNVNSLLHCQDDQTHQSSIKSNNETIFVPCNNENFSSAKSSKSEVKSNSRTSSFICQNKQMMNLSALATGSFLLNSTMKSPLMTSSPATDNSIFDDVITKKYLKSSLSSNRSTTASDEKELVVGDSGGMPGMELVSPCNMSLATRNFMSKHHLIEDFKNENNPSLGASPRLSGNNKLKPQRKNFRTKRAEDLIRKKLTNRNAEFEDTSVTYLINKYGNENEAPLQMNSSKRRVYDMRKYESNPRDSSDDSYDRRTNFSFGHKNQVITPTNSRLLRHSLDNDHGNNFKGSMERLHDNSQNNRRTSLPSMLAKQSPNHKENQNLRFSKMNRTTEATNKLLMPKNNELRNFTSIVRTVKNHKKFQPKLFSHSILE